MAKSLVLTYILWLFGGFIGLHHFYLNRIVHGFLYMCCPGGYFGAGWIRDIWRIPSYVKEANNDPDFNQKLAVQMQTLQKPAWSFARLGGQLVIGNLFGLLTRMCIPGPEDIGMDLLIVADLIAPFATALGIYLVGNIGNHQGSLRWPLIGCYIMTPVHIMGYTSFVWTTIMGIIAFQMYSKSWRRQIRPPRSKCSQFFIVFICFNLYLSMWSCYIYFNLTIVTKEGEKIKFRDAVGNFLQSPAFQEFSKSAKHLWKHMLDHGFWSTLEELVENLDPLGERHALKVLELKKGASQEDIKARYRELSKKWHPDRFKDEQEKSEAHEKFVGIQQAYEKLSQIKKRRKSKNTVQNNEDDRSEF